MRGQSHRNYCGPACVANILRAYGIDREATEDKVAKKLKLAQALNENSPADGTTEAQLIKAFGLYKLPHDQIQVHDPALAVAALRGFLDRGIVSILCVDNSQHWLLALATMGERVVIVDPADPELVLCYPPSELLGRWKAAGDPATYYSLVVYPRTRKRK